MFGGKIKIVSAKKIMLKVEAFSQQLSIEQNSKCPRKRIEIRLENLGNRAANQRKIILKMWEKGIRDMTSQEGFENVA